MRILNRLSQTQFKKLQKLTYKKYRQLEHRFIIEGVHLVEEALSSDWEVEYILVTSDFIKSEGNKEIFNRALKHGVSTLLISRKELERLSDAVNAQGIIGIVNEKEFTIDAIFKRITKSTRLVALESISDPGNLGAIIRTCDWFGIDGVILSNSCVELYCPKVLRSSMGSVFHIPIVKGLNFNEILPSFKSIGLKIIGTTLTGGTLLTKMSFAFPSVIIFGNESRGISQEILNQVDELVTIPRFGKSESLNVAVACGIILNTIRQRE